MYVGACNGGRVLKPPSTPIVQNSEGLIMLMKQIALTHSIFATPNKTLGHIKWQSVSFGDISSVPIGYRYTLYLYGDNEKYLLSHTQKHVIHAHNLLAKDSRIVFVLSILFIKTIL